LRILEAADGDVEGGELLADCAEARQVGNEAPVVGVAGGPEDVWPDLGAGGEQIGEPIAEGGQFDVWDCIVLG
jgi:hypothetical protein